MLCAVVLGCLDYTNEIDLKDGLVITESVVVKKATYQIPNTSDDGQSAAITIRGKNITVDFNDATLRGSSPDALPSDRNGVGVRIEGENVTIKNAKIHGYKVGVIARSVPGLKIDHVDVSYNWKQRLMSTLEREDSSDWMSFHRNEQDQWLRFGAGLYLVDCDRFEVKESTAVGGQCGLMMTDCDDGKVWNNNFSFLSAIGIGMYRSSRNTVMHNNIDWCVRGYSHGVYNRGQDSAGILIYEQSNKNVFAYNSVTHGGDGFFLWAGQTTMDTGEGGCNDNLLFGNDFSHAPTNGIEATFSRNQFINNLILECWHGIWGGYSYESIVHSNYFGLNAEGIAWEHGQDNVFERNIFDRDLNAINLWQNKTQDPNWVYPKKRDTRARDNVIQNNEFLHVTAMVLRVRDTFNTVFRNNELINNGGFIDAKEANEGLRVVANRMITPVEIGPYVTGNAVKVDPTARPKPATMQPSGNVILGLDPDTEDYLARFDVKWQAFPGPRIEINDKPFPAPALLNGGNVPFLKKGTLRGRRYILVDEWGPYDFLSPKLWPRGQRFEGSKEFLRFDVLGPSGAWKLRSQQGLRIIGSTTGSVPGQIEVEVQAGTGSETRLELDYVGGRTVDFRGVATPAGQVVPFGYRKFHLPIEWSVAWFNYDQNKADPRTQLAEFKRVIAGPPVREERTRQLNYAWGGSPGQGVNPDYFATVANGEFEISPGEYVLNVTSDDGVRVWLDGKVVLENWTYHGPTLDTATLKLGGRHRLRVEHFELNGYSALKVEIRPKE